MSADTLVIGAGFFGMYIAAHLARNGHKVTLVEKESSPMQRASAVNQARVHQGYHYPRSLLTASRSRVSFPRFCEEFSDAVVDEFDNFYLIGRAFSKVSAKQFEVFCKRIGAPCQSSSALKEWVNPRQIEAVYRTVEYAFDCVRLEKSIAETLAQYDIEPETNTHVTSVQRGRKQALRVSYQTPTKEVEGEFDHVFNCTYSGLNQFANDSDIPVIPLKHELTEMCLVQPPAEFENFGLTVMCGPFFSMMPFPSKQLHSFSHVRYTPHFEWHQGGVADVGKSYDRSVTPDSAWQRMRKDAARFIPGLADSQYVESLWEVKTVMPRSEVDDSRPILFRANHGLPGLHMVLGGKIDNVFDAVAIIEQLGLS